MNIIDVMNLVFRYKRYNEEQKPVKQVDVKERNVINNISLSINKGDFVGILGHNGSGKSTLAKLLTALLQPAGGVIYVKGMNTSDRDRNLDIRKTAGIVFQNPDNQLIGATVEEDVAFGLENLGVPGEEMEDRITGVLDSLGMSAWRVSAPGTLSGGQKQKIAIAGILAMEPECIVFDEPTAMLDPAGRQEVREAVRYLNREKGITVIYITHHTDEVEDADYLYIMKEGEVVLYGSPESLWAKTGEVLACGVDVPYYRGLIHKLEEAGIQLSTSRSEAEIQAEEESWTKKENRAEEEDRAKKENRAEEESRTKEKITAEDQLVEILAEKIMNQDRDSQKILEIIKNDCSIMGGSGNQQFNEKRREASREDIVSSEMDSENAKSPGIDLKDFTSLGISLENVSFSYDFPIKDKDSASYAIKNISLSIKKGESVAIVGQTGSGKSTLLQHLNGLLLPTSGTCRFNGEDISSKGFSLKKLRQKVGYCFQYPDYQLFEETVLKDIAFGPSNLGWDEETCIRKARRAMELTGLSADMEDVSPFALSGGQKRRAALAGILAMEPDFLILDEPAAGLDKEGKDRMFALLKRLNQEKEITLVMVSHDMNDVAKIARRVIMMKDGEILADGSAAGIFSDIELLHNAGLAQPDSLCFARHLYSYSGGGSWEER